MTIVISTTIKKVSILVNLKIKSNILAFGFIISRKVKIQLKHIHTHTRVCAVYGECVIDEEETCQKWFEKYHAGSFSVFD